MRGIYQRAGLKAFGRFGGQEAEAVDTAHGLALHRNCAIFIHCRHQFFLLGQTPHEQARAAVDKTLCQSLMQGIGELVFDFFRPLLPKYRGFQPVRAVCHKSPGADMGNPCRQRIDIAICFIAMAELAGEPVLADFAASRGEEAEYSTDDTGMFRRADIAVVRNLAHLPQALYEFRRGDGTYNFVIAAQRLQRIHVRPGLRTGEAMEFRQCAKRTAKAVERAEIKIAVAPLQHVHGIEGVVLQPLHHLIVKGLRFAGHAKGAVAQMAPGAAGDLTQLRRREIAPREAIELAGGGEGHMVDIHVEPHADGIRCHHIIHIAGLEECDLRVARARTERAHDHGGTTALAADEFGGGIDHLRREGDDGAPPRQAAHFLLARIGEFGEPRARHELRAGNELLDNGPHGGGTQQHGLIAPTAMENAVGENMPALEIRRDLDFINGKKTDGHIGGHGFNGADPVFRAGRNDLLFAGNQRHRMIAGALAHPVKHLARQKPERQADHPRRLRQHTLHREMGLAGVGGAEDSGNGFGRGHEGSGAVREEGSHGGDWSGGQGRAIGRE